MRYRIPHQSVVHHQQRNVSPAGPEYTDADVIAIREMFPSFDEEIVKII